MAGRISASIIDLFMSDPEYIASTSSVTLSGQGRLTNLVHVSSFARSTARPVIRHIRLAVLLDRFESGRERDRPRNDPGDQREMLSALGISVQRRTLTVCSVPISHHDVCSSPEISTYPAISLDTGQGARGLVTSELEGRAVGIRAIRDELEEDIIEAQGSLVSMWRDVSNCVVCRCTCE